MTSILGYLANFVAGAVALTAALYMLSLAVPRAGFVARVLASYLALVFTTFVGFFATILIALAGYQGLSQWFVGRLFQHIMRWAVGVDFVIEDPGNVLATTRPAVFIGNHQTELDVLMLGCMFPKYCSITAKSSLRRLPFLGWWMSISGSIFIDRKNSRDAREAMQGAAKEIRAKRQSVYMFPEGTRSYAKDPMLLPFKKGAFHLAVQAGVPIVPVVVSNYSHVLYPKAMHFVAGKIPIKVLDPIPTEGLTSADVDELARTTRELMLKELVPLSERAQGRPMSMPGSTPVNGKATATGIDTTI
jgi:lysophosphatidate acyltransferase